ncbi:MAG TPA: dihydropteroate synthase [Bdellovibrionota bacterium]|nr:dihydropteroate synthase [Bdellovibrionota bacterium]
MLNPNELILGLGSNSGKTPIDALAMLRRAKRLLQCHTWFELLAVSPIYASEALLPSGAPPEWNRPFLNAALRLRVRDRAALSSNDAGAILEQVKVLERTLGRAEGPRWSPRVIDIDILDWGAPPVSSAEITIPHSELTKRPFALLPLQDCLERPDPRREPLEWRYSHHDQVPFRTRRAPFAWPEIVTILNVTPDSFSESGSPGTGTSLLRRLEPQVREGATIIDLGGESTRPDARPLSPEEEYNRLLPVLPAIQDLKNRYGITFSLDSRHPEVTQWVNRECPVDWINDVEGFTNPRMIELAKETSCDLVVMHSLTIPPNRNVVLNPQLDPISQLMEWATERISTLTRAGIARERLILDPGIGFGKTARQNQTIFERSREFLKLGTRVLIGHSRKRFLDPDDLVPAGDRDLETAVLSSRLALSGIDYIRVHSPRSNERSLRLGNRL